ncbi:MAG TPA: hypothetical protein PLB78_16975, partial [Anaerolineae bacterium]|nr:hypothetical protein [Anaerolineae bacterium]
MDTRLTSQEMQQLVPLLGSLARVAASSPTLDEATIEVLLLGADVEPSTRAVSELMRWAKLLRSLQQKPELRVAVVEALKQRGLPEASVLLAVGEISSAASPPTPGAAAAATAAPAARLTCSVA